MGKEWKYNTPYVGIDFGMVFIKDVFFSKPFQAGNDRKRSFKVTPRYQNDWYSPVYDRMSISTPYTQALGECAFFCYL